MLIRVLGATWRRWRDWRWRNAAIRELRTLDDRTLKDMGLTRGEIVAAVDGQIHGREPVRPHGSQPPSPRPPDPARAEPIDPGELQRHLHRARHLRAEFMTGLVRRGLGRLARLLRRTLSAPPRHTDGRRPACCVAASPAIERTAP